MKKTIRLTENDLKRIVKKVIKEDIDGDTMNKLDELENELTDILKAMNSFCNEASGMHEMNLPHYDDDDDFTYEDEDYLSKYAFIDAIKMQFEQILDEYYY